MWGNRGLQARILLDEYATVIAVVFLIALLVGGGLIYTTYVAPGTTTEERSVGQWETGGEYTHSSTITEENRVYPVGTTLEGRSLYYTRLGPELDGTFRYTFDVRRGAASDDALDTTIETTLVIRSVGEGGETFWRVDEPLDSTNATLQPGATATTNFTVNVSALREEIDAIRSDLGASPGETEVFVVSTVDASGTVAGQPTTHSSAHRLAIDPGAGTYGVAGNATTEQHQRTEQVTTERSFGPVGSAAGPLLAVLGLVGLIALGVGHQQGVVSVSEAERAAYRTRREHESFDEWISSGRVPPSARAGKAVAVDSLEDLVDAAIDSDRRVIHDPADGSYHVIDDALRYEYAPSAGVDTGNGTLLPDSDELSTADGADAESADADSPEAEEDEANGGPTDGTGEDAAVDGDEMRRPEDE